MLVIGDYVTNKYNSEHPVDIYEAFYNDHDELESFIRKKNLCCSTTDANPLVKEYLQINSTDPEDDIVFRFYDKKILDEHTEILKFISNKSFERKGKETLVSPFFNFIFDSIRVINYHNDPEEWLQSMYSYDFLKKEFIIDLLEYKDVYKNRITKYVKLLYPMIDKIPRITTKSFQYFPYMRVNKQDILATVTESSLNASPLYKMSKKDKNKLIKDEFDMHVFNRFSPAEKLIAATESCFVDTTHEYVMPHIAKYNAYPSNIRVYHAFLDSIMHRLSQNKDFQFRDYILDNFMKINDNYKHSFLDTFKKAQLNGFI